MTPTIETRDRLPVSLNGLRFTIDVASYRRGTIDATRQLNDQGGEVGEQTLNSEYVWKRTAEDFRLGAGQTYFDIVETSTRRRFRDSIGIDPWDQRNLRLLPRPTARAATATPPCDAWLFVVGGQLIYAYNLGNGGVVADSYAIAFVDDPTAAEWTLTEITGAAGLLESICADGSSLYYKVAGANQLKRVRITGPGTWSTTDIGDNTKVVTNLQVVAGRLLGQTFAAVGSTDYLVEVKATTQTTIASYEGTQMPILTGAVAGPGGVFVAGITRRESNADWSGVQSAIYRMTIDETSGALSVPAPVAALPDGEAITSALAYSGYLVLGTSAGIRLGRWTATGGVEYGPVIEVDVARDVRTNTVATRIVGTYANGVTALEGDGPYVWFGWPSKMFAHADGTVQPFTGLGRLNLARFVDDLQPAYATDMMIPDLYERPVLTAASFGGNRYFVVQADGAYGQANEVMEKGYLDVGQITFGTPEPKRIVSVELRTNPLPDGCAINVQLANEFGELAFVDTHAGFSAYEMTSPVDDLAGDSCSLMLTLGRGWVETEGPTLRRWTVRALAIPMRQEEIWLPIRLEDLVTAGTGDVTAIKIHDEFTKLRALMMSRTVIVLEMGNEAIDVIIDSLQTGADTDVKLKDWNDAESWPEGLWFVKCITV